MLTYRFHNMASLRFYLLEEDGTAGAVQILRRKRLRRRNYQLDLRIIGSSHMASLRTASTQLSEWLTCLPKGDIEGKALMACPISLDSSELTTTVGDVRYTIRFHAARLESEEYQRQHLLLLRSTDETLRYEFPVQEGTAKLNPLTLLKYSCQAERIHLWTYHTYPDECGIVDTHTCIEF